MIIACILLGYASLALFALALWIIFMDTVKGGWAAEDNIGDEVDDYTEHIGI